MFTIVGTLRKVQIYNPHLSSICCNQNNTSQMVLPLPCTQPLIHRPNNFFRVGKKPYLHT